MHHRQQHPLQHSVKRMCPCFLGVEHCRVGEYICKGMQEFEPNQKYDLIWCQWVSEVNPQFKEISRHLRFITFYYELSFLCIQRQATPAQSASSCWNCLSFPQNLQPVKCNCWWPSNGGLSVKPYCRLHVHATGYYLCLHKRSDIMARGRINASHCLSSPRTGFNSQTWRGISRDFSRADHTPLERRWVPPSYHKPVERNMKQYSFLCRQLLLPSASSALSFFCPQAPLTMKMLMSPKDRHKQIWSSLPSFLQDLPW